MLEDAVPTRSFATRSLFLGFCAAVALTAGAVAAEPAANCPPRPGFAMLSQEQRLMMFADLKAQADAGAVDMDVLRQMQREKFRAMSEDQRKAYFDGLSKRWAALPAGDKVKLKAEALKWRAEHPRPEGGFGGHHRPDCAPAK
jgi:hypothetical protein